MAMCLRISPFDVSDDSLPTKDYPLFETYASMAPNFLNLRFKPKLLLRYNLILKRPRTLDAASAHRFAQAIPL
jgi:hypothetical protein